MLNDILCYREVVKMKSEQIKISKKTEKTPLEKRLDIAIAESERILANNPKWVSEKEFWERMEKV